MGNYLPAGPFLGTLNRDSGEEEASEEASENVSPGSSIDLESSRKRPASPNKVENFKKRKRMKSTIDHIYQVLFLKGEGSDITIYALGETFKLHKLYLSQCQYFASMFSGKWKDQGSELHMDIPDPAITVESLTTTFGSLYSDHVNLESSKVESVLATAALLQLTGLCDQCAALMLETFSTSTICSYYDASRLYGLVEVEEAAMQWLLHNVMCKKDLTMLRNMSMELLMDVISSPNLMVMQVELDVYFMVKKWIFIHCCPDYEDRIKQQKASDAADAYFEEYLETSGAECFIESPKGERYKDLLELVPLHHVLASSEAWTLLNKVPLYSKEAMLAAGAMNWRILLLQEQGEDVGPKDCSEQVFAQHAFRCGRLLPKQAEYCWRWSGFRCGIDLLVIVSPTTGTIKLRRNRFQGNVRTPECKMLSMSYQRHIAYQLTVVSSDSLGRSTTVGRTCMKRLTLKTGEEAAVFDLPGTVHYPLFVGLRLLLHTPKGDNY